MDVPSFFMGMLAGIAAGSLVIIVAAFVRGKAETKLMAAGMTLVAGISIILFEDILSWPWSYSSAFGAAALVGGLWPFALLLFGAERSRAVMLAPLVSLLLISTVGPFTPLFPLFMGLHRIIMIATSVAVVVFVLRSEEDDLDPVRRRIRRPFIALVGAWIALTSVLAALARFDLRPEWLASFDEFGSALLALWGAVLFTAPRTALLRAASVAAAPSRDNPEDEAVLARLDQLMTIDQVWLEEGLTVGSLAEMLGVPEHQLRPLINQRLGYRNFAAFINEHRLSEAKRRLRSPEHKKETVASIAYACGFGSLGPFGRAFKEETGMTPTAFRRAAKSKEEA